MKLSCIVVLILLAGRVGAQEPPVSFKNDVMPIFMRGGCNAGDCHGSARGKDGFMLSLFGYDPEGDYYRILEEFPGRRVNLARPEKSLLLEKATGAVAHTGGEVLKPDSAHYQTLLKWLKEGAPRDREDAPVIKGIELMPRRMVFDSAATQTQAKVQAYYSDGSERDITDLALYFTGNEGTVTIDEQARVHPKQSGGAHVFARFDKFTVGSEVIVLPEGSFDWPSVPENNYIDRLVFAKLKELRIRPSDLSTDEHFLRRVTIDLTGKLPTPEEYAAFMENSAPTKRADWIETLLKREAFGELWAAKWGEWLRISTDTNPGSGTAMKAGWNYYQWVREQMVNNVPWNEFAHDLVTGNGSNFRNPPSNYYTMLPQGRLMPEKLGEDTAQIFLGVRTQCAQCHNHPFDRWTMDDYYSFTSFFTGVRRKHGSEAREYYTFVDVDAEPAPHKVDGRPMPHRFLGGALADVHEKDPRKALADWMTAPDNRLFRRNLANRIWAHFFGRGIVEQVDDIRISNPPSNEPLLEELGQVLAGDYRFDIRKLVRDICRSRTYQLSVTTHSGNRADDRYFSHAYLRRLRADVLFDCLGQALDYQHRFRRSTAERAVVMFEGGRRDNFNRYFFATFGQAERKSVCSCEDVVDANLSQALHLINGRTIDDAFNRNPVLIPELEASSKNTEEIVRKLYIRMLTREPSADEMLAFLKQDPVSQDKKKQRAYYNSVAWALVNSSEFIFNH